MNNLENYFQNKFCTKCGVYIFYDDIEHEWGCECTFAYIILDEDLMPSVEWEPRFWVDKPDNKPFTLIKRKNQ